MELTAPLTAYVHMHALEGIPEPIARLRADALRALREELASLQWVRVTPLPQDADFDVEITNVMRVDEAPHGRYDARRQRILVVRLGRKGERLDFVCTDGRNTMSAEQQAARRIRGWIAGERTAADPVRARETSATASAA